MSLRCFPSSGCSLVETYFNARATFIFKTFLNHLGPLWRPGSSAGHTQNSKRSLISSSSIHCCPQRSIAQKTHSSSSFSGRRLPQRRQHFKTVLSVSYLPSLC